MGDKFDTYYWRSNNADSGHWSVGGGGKSGGGGGGEEVQEMLRKEEDLTQTPKNADGMSLNAISLLYLVLLSKLL